MRSWSRKVILLVVCFCVTYAAAFAQQAPSLGAAHDFNVLGWSKVSDAGGTIINASVGVADGPIAGLPAGSVKRERHVKNDVAIEAQKDARAAFANAFWQIRTDFGFTASNLSGKTLTPGVYTILGDASLAGVLTLDGQNKPNATFIIKVGGNFIATNNGIIRLKSGATSKNVFFIVDNEIQISSNSDLVGNFLAEDNVRMENSRLLGRLVSLYGEVNLKNSSLNLPVDLVITMKRSMGSSGPDTYAFGEEITYEIKVENKGPVNEEGIKVRDINVLGTLIQASSTLPQTLYNPQTGIWTVGALGYGESAELKLTTVINKAGISTVSALVEGAGVDETLQNNSVVQNFCVLLSEPTPIIGPTEVCAGGKYIYRAEPVSGATRYTWKFPDNWKWNYVDPTGADLTVVEVITDGTSGAVSLKVGNVCGEGPARSLDVISVLGVPEQPSAIEGPVTLCIGASNIVYSVEEQPNTDTYTWNLPDGWSLVSGQGTRRIVVNAGTVGGKVSVIPTNTCGDGQEQALQVLVNAAPPAAPSAIKGSGQGCVGGATTYEVVAVAGAKYYWSVPAGWTITAGEYTHKITVRVGTGEGVVSVLAENACGRGPATSIPVKPVSIVAPTPGPITGDLNSCINAAGLTYSIEPVPTATHYIWKLPSGWSFEPGQDQNSNRIKVNANSNGGELSVIAVNDCGASVKSAIIIQPTASKPATPGAITGSVYGCVSKTGIYSIAAVNGANTYTWEVPAGWQISSGNGTTRIEVVAGTTSGKISVRAKNSCGESSVRELSVNPQTGMPSPPATITGPSEVCQGESGYEYKVTPIPGVKSYTWKVPAGWAITSGESTATIKVTAGTAGGNITVSAINDCGAGAEARMAVAVVPSPPDKPGAITGLASVCVNQKNVVYSIQPVKGASSYKWSVGANSGWKIISGHGTTSIVVDAGPVATTIAVQAINACGVTSETQLTTVVTDGVPAKPGAISGSTVLCAGNEYTFSIQPVEDALSYKWELPDGWERVADNGGTSIKVRTNSTAGTVRVLAMNSCGSGPEQTLSVTPSKTAPLAPGEITGNADACVSGEATFSIADVVGASGYVWRVPSGWSIVSGQNTTTVKVKVGKSAGDISVAAKNDCGEGGLTTRRITISTAAPAKPGAITGEQATCENKTLTYSISAVSGAKSYEWKAPEGWTIVSGQGTTKITVKAGSKAGNISVTANNGCGGSGTTVLAVSPATATPIAPGAITPPAYTFCQGATSLPYAIAPVAGATGYRWEVPDGWVIKAGQNTTSITVTAGATAGQISVTAINPCGDGGSQVIDVAPQSTPLVAQIEIGPKSPCAGISTTYSVTANTNIDTYLWEVPQGWEIVAGQGTGTIEVKPTTAGGKVKVTAKNSCGAAGTAEIDVSPAQGSPVAPASITGNTGICAGSTATYSVPNANPFTSYTWAVPQGWEITSGQGTGAITVKAGDGSGAVSVVASTGCGTAGAVAVDVSSMDEQGLKEITELSSPCAGLVYAVAPLAGAKTYTWTVPAGWSILAGQGTPRITVKAGSGEGIIAVTAGNGGCTTSSVSLRPNVKLANTDLFFPNVFSPNGDGDNDKWLIKNIESYPDNEVTIINRWGNEVYRSKSYQNNWNGDKLSEGTYYYVVKVKLCDGEDKVFKGFVMIVR